jgi:hypothetical protein
LEHQSYTKQGLLNNICRCQRVLKIS